MWSAPVFDEKWQQAATERDPAKRNELLTELGVHAIENSLYATIGKLLPLCLAVGKELLRREHCGSCQSGAHLCPHMARPGAKESDGMLGCGLPAS